MNYGVIEGRRDTDWLGGTIPWEDRNPTGNWKEYLPKGELQYDKQTHVDTMGCVSFAHNNTIETQLIFAGKDVNLSDRFLAKVSGTTQEGNYLWRVADAFRAYGCPQEFQWAAPKKFTWDTYYAPIPKEVYAQAVKYQTRYEFLTDLSKDALAHELRHAPIQITIPGHSISLYDVDDLYKYFDTYSPFMKETESIVSAMKLVYYDNINTTPMTAKQVRKLQALEGYHDEAGVTYWTGKSLEDYLNARLPDKQKEIEAAMQ